MNKKVTLTVIFIFSAVLLVPSSVLMAKAGTASIATAGTTGSIGDMNQEVYVGQLLGIQLKELTKGADYYLALDNGTSDITSFYFTAASTSVGFQRVPTTAGVLTIELYGYNISGSAISGSALATVRINVIPVSEHTQEDWFEGLLSGVFPVLIIVLLFSAILGGIAYKKYT